MSQSSKKRTLPKNITERPDADALELILGKRVKKELDKVVQAIDKKSIRVK